MKKRLLTVMALVLIASAILAVTALAAPARQTGYYDEQGNRITVSGLYYNRQGHPMFSAGCFYLDANGEPVYVGGCRVYYYDESGNLIPGRFYYDSDGNAVPRPRSYPGGFGCGRFYYDADGNPVSGTFYYDDFGNRINSPQNPNGFRGGNCCRR